MKEFALMTPPPRVSHATYSLSLRLGLPWYLSLRKQEKNKSLFTQLAHRRLLLYKPTPTSLTILIPTLPTQNPNYHQISFLRNLIHRTTKTSTFDHRSSR